MQIDLSTFPTGQKFLRILALGMVRLNGGTVTPQDFKTIVDKARASGRNADFVQEVVQDEMRELVETAPPEELDLLQNAFFGERCQRGLVWKAIQDLALENA